MSRNPNTHHNRRQLVDGVLWEAKSPRALLLGALVTWLVVMFGVLSLGLPAAANYPILGVLTVLICAGYAVWQYRKLSVGPQGLVFHGLVRTRGLRWEDIVAVEVKLRPGKRESPGYAVVRCTMREGDRKRHTLNFLAEDMLPYLAVDLRYYAAQRGIPVQVNADAAIVRTVDLVEAGASR